MTITPQEFEWREYRLREGRYKGYVGPRPKSIPPVYRIPPTWHARLAAFVLRRKVKPQPQTPYSLFSELGGFVSQAGSFPPDTESAKAFRAAGGKWLAVQFGDPTTDQGNRARFMEGWPERWRLLGVQVGAWWRVEHVGIPVPQTPPVDFLIPNPESAAELERLPGILQASRARIGSMPLAVITLGKIPGFPTGLLETLDVHLIPECFLETAEADTTVTNSVRYWRDSGVALHRLHASLLHKPGGDRYPLAVAVAEARTLKVVGLSSFTSENTPAGAWGVMA